MTGKSIFTIKQDEFLYRNYADFINKELVSLEIFKDKTSEQIAGRAKYLKLKKTSKTISRTLSEAHKGIKPSKETKAKKSRIMKEKIKNGEIKVLRGEESSFWGKKHTQETKESISKKNRGKNNGMYGRTGKKCPSYGKSPQKGTGHSKHGVRNDIGHFVRSSYEANYARILQYHDIYYLYEPYRFKIDKLGKTYVPDFYIPILDIFIETKGYEDVAFKQKFDAFKEQYPEVKIFIVNREEMLEYHKEYVNKLPNWERVQ